ncbi:hypothetical protein HHK36_001978 [Tetracentron sinense]|uniref:Uncharacterized protein n=1 Tax=Tetracentron sinense TaxID=13715 RepID=A0A834ZYG0_TETSI|nr:hypothetical protein HHK36_001978 [Tetracentron sinense]
MLLQSIATLCESIQSMKPERRLFFSIHTEGAILKVLNIIDSIYHLLNDMKDTRYVAKSGTAGVNHHYSMLSVSIGECPSGFKCGINYQPPMEEFGSPAGVIGNPMGFASNVGLDIKDFLSVTSKGILLVHQYP